MEIKQFVLREIFNNQELTDLKKFLGNSKFLCLTFYGKKNKFIHDFLNTISIEFPAGEIVGCSSAGHVGKGFVFDDEIVVTFIKFHKTNFNVLFFENVISEKSETIGENLSLQIPSNVKSALLLSEGLNINGSKLVSGLKKIRPLVNFFGGLSGDGFDFKETFILKGNKLYSNSIVLVCFDKNLNIESSVGSGWSSFGAEKEVSRSRDNIIYEIDERPAIEMYDNFLGERKVLLPSYGLHFPVFLEDENEKIVRTLLAINREDRSLTFAGDVPEKSKIKLMRSTPESLVKAANSAFSALRHGINSDSLYFMVSCVGRRLVLGESVEDECEGQLGKTDYLTGFYSYGEINSIDNNCKLHNQTFTLTRIYEDE